MNERYVTFLLATTVATAVPLTFCSLGETIAELSGVINVGIEAMLLSGAFAAYVCADSTHNWILGVLAGAGAGAAMAAVFALACLKFKANQVVAGTALNILSFGLTGVLYRAIGPSLPIMADNQGVPHYALPVLSKIPLFGQSLFSAGVLTFLAFVLVPITWWFIRKTRPGQALRAVGELPDAARSAGWDPQRVRLAAILFGGLMAGIGGANLSIDYTHGFIPGMSGGKGFIALAVVIVGRWSPTGALVGSLLFGAASAAQVAFQAGNTHMPYQIFLALPYVLTLAVLVVRAGRSAAPGVLGRDLEAA